MKTKTSIAAVFAISCLATSVYSICHNDCKPVECFKQNGKIWYVSDTADLLIEHWGQEETNKVCEFDADEMEVGGQPVQPVQREVKPGKTWNTSCTSQSGTLGGTCQPNGSVQYASGCRKCKRQESL